MKTILPVSIWDNGVSKEANVLNAYASEVILNKSATFQYALYNNPVQPVLQSLAQGVVFMNEEEYSQWEQDEFAWEFVANKLNLTITGDYTTTTTTTTTTPLPTTSTTTTEVV